MNKFLITLFIAFNLFFISCSKESILDDDTIENLQEDAIDEMLAIASNDATATQVEDKRKSSMKKCKHPHNLTALVLKFEELPQITQDYLHTLVNENIYAVFILKIENDNGKVRYSVRLNNGLHAHFTADGTLKKQVTKNKKFESLLISQLPTTIQDYITANIDPATIIGSLRVTRLNDKIKYSVRTNNNTRYIFDESGSLVRVK
jgi:hypothetical protein